MFCKHLGFSWVAALCMKKADSAEQLCGYAPVPILASAHCRPRVLLQPPRAGNLDSCDYFLEWKTSAHQLPTILVRASMSLWQRFYSEWSQHETYTDIPCPRQGRQVMRRVRMKVGGGREGRRNPRSCRWPFAWPLTHHRTLGCRSLELPAHPLYHLSSLSQARRRWFVVQHTL